MSTNLMSQFLSGLRDLRKGRRTTADAIYWRAAKAIAAGTKPRDKEADIAEALDKLNRDENDLARDAEALAELLRVEEQAKRQPATRDRLKHAANALREAEAKARDLERQARDLRGNAEAAVAESRNESNAATKASTRAAEIRRELARRGHPEFIGLIEQTQRDRQVEALQNDLAAAEREVAEAEKAVATWPQNLLAGPVDSAMAGGARRAARQVAVARDRRNRLAKQLAELRGGTSDDATGEDVTADLSAEVQQ